MEEREEKKPARYNSHFQILLANAHPTSKVPLGSELLRLSPAHLGTQHAPDWLRDVRNTRAGPGRSFHFRTDYRDRSVVHHAS